jgi:hypothetical protein
VYSPFFLVVSAIPRGDSYLGAVGFLAILTSVWLSTTSGLLLLDTERHRIWGVIVALSYVIAFGPLYFFSQLFRSASSWLALE